jgi:anti-sigma regulatory factor (Ser/Thr protein kinase)
VGTSPPQPAENPLTLREHLPATVESVSVARRAVRRFVQGLEVDVDGIALAVSEAVANVVAHAYAEAGGTIELSATASRGEVAVVVRDRGRGLDPARPSRGAGFGMEIIRRLAQQVTLDDTSSGVALTMRFRRGGAWSAR